MIKINKSDTIIDIIEKIELSKSKDITLSFPLGHPIIHNFISLKILKSKVKDGTLTIVSHDNIAKNIVKKLGINFSYVGIKNRKNTSNLFKDNFNILEYIKIELKKYKKEFLNLFKLNSNKNSILKKSDTTIVQSHFLFISLIISVGIFIFLYYSTISKTEIYITPEIKVKNESLNFIFKENISNSILGGNKNIKIEKYITTIKSTEIYGSTDINIDDSQISRGIVTLINKTNEEQALVKNTRLNTKDGLEFILLESKTIPAGVEDNFGNISEGRAKVEVIAKKIDLYGSPIGERGNITEGISMTIPGLPDDLQEKIYAVSSTKFKGGISNFKKKVSEQDLKSGEQIFIEKIKTKALEAAQKEIREKSKINNLQLKILGGEESVKYSDLNIDLNNTKPGDIKDTFQISGSITLTVYVFDAESVVQKLKTVISEKTLLGVEKVSHIDDSSLRFTQLIYLNTEPFELKGTYEIDFFTLYDFNNEDSMYMRGLKSKIRGLHKDSAYNLLINDPKISKVEINIRPFFIETISNIYNNIVIKIDEK